MPSRHTRTAAPGEWSASKRAIIWSVSFFRIGGDAFVPQERDLVVAGLVAFVPRGEEFDGVGAGRRGPAAEAFMAAAESAEAGALVSVRTENAHGDVDGDLVDLAEDEVVFVRFERVADGVAG